jgi:SMC interacting uncharacterized protein involved in chromosome segregation
VKSLEKQLKEANEAADKLKSDAESTKTAQQSTIDKLKADLATAQASAGDTGLLHFVRCWRGIMVGVFSRL